MAECKQGAPQQGVLKISYDTGPTQLVYEKPISATNSSWRKLREEEKICPSVECKGVWISDGAPSHRNLNQECRGPFSLARVRATTASATLLDRRKGVQSTTSVSTTSTSLSSSQSTFLQRVWNISCSDGVSGVSGRVATSSVCMQGRRPASSKSNDEEMVTRVSSRTASRASSSSMIASHPTPSAALGSDTDDTKGRSIGTDDLKCGPNWFSMRPGVLF